MLPTTAAVPLAHVIGRFVTADVQLVASSALLKAMRPRHILLTLLALGGWPTLAAAPPDATSATDRAPRPLVIGQTLELDSKILRERRRINVYRPLRSGTGNDTRWPVLYMPDGGIAEDFLHVAGLVQVSVANGTMRPFVLVGIENTERRRDLTAPTDDPADRRIAPRVGGSAAFRAFIRSELKPLIAQRYPVTSESAIVGESLTGLLVVETWLEDPALFDHYIAFDPSLWWNRGEHLRRAEARRPVAAGATPKPLYIGSSSEPELAKAAARFCSALRRTTDALQLHCQSFATETHLTLYHPAALHAFRTLFAPLSVRGSQSSSR